MTPSSPLAATQAGSKVDLARLLAMRAAGEPIAMLTCYDFPTARILAECGVPLLLVGDSAAMAVLGEDSTLPVTMDYMVTITRAVRRGAPGVYLMADMPFGSYSDEAAALTNARRFVREAGAEVVKLECDAGQAKIVQVLAAEGITVCAHLGLLPQRAAEMGGYKAQGRTASDAQRIIQDALVLRQAGATMFLLEAVPDQVSAAIRAQTDCLVLGCGAGPSCDGHVIVLPDLLGFNPKPARFVEVMGNVPAAIRVGVQAYLDAVAKRQYPAPKHQYQMKSPA
ncbi:MAG: 3-methyl-2-oxobutanoate hydroxymethyltransferase [Phycisphaerae bacterium]